ncbi:adenylyl cyclase [Mycobacterium tuberculosis]|nr:adenylyl cyclase [Mycobacterium tuberculosis]
MTDHVREADDANIDDLLGDLGGTARAERAKLVEWLLEQGITPDEIRATNPPLLLATRPSSATTAPTYPQGRLARTMALTSSCCSGCSALSVWPEWMILTRWCTCVPTVRRPHAHSGSLSWG